MSSDLIHVMLLLCEFCVGQNVVRSLPVSCLAVAQCGCIAWCMTAISFVAVLIYLSVTCWFFTGLLGVVSDMLPWCFGSCHALVRVATGSETYRRRGMNLMYRRSRTACATCARCVVHRWTCVSWTPMTLVCSEYCCLLTCVCLSIQFVYSQLMQTPFVTACQSSCVSG